LVGDAAHSVHPLAGQGVNLGMLDAAVLVQCVVEAVELGKDPGDIRALRRYERWRKPANEMMVRMLDSIQTAFQPVNRSAWQQAVLRTARSAALDLTNRVGPVNRACMRAAMGMSGDVPDLARGKLPCRDRVLAV